jgi:hypothetical protein
VLIGPNYGVANLYFEADADPTEDETLTFLDYIDECSHSGNVFNW